MEHSFDIEIAREYGINQAIILKHLYFWIEKNRANNKHYHDGHYWTYNSKKAFADLFPYLTERQIDYALTKLVEAGLIIKGNYNALPYDRTLWYAITTLGYSILQNCKMSQTKLLNETNEIVRPIPDNKPDNKPDNNIISSDTKKEEVVEKIPKSEHERVRHKIDKLQVSNALKTAILKYMKHRVTSGQPVTTVYLDIMLKQLEENSGGDEQTKIKIIEQAINNGYRELYPLKGNNTFNSKNRSLEVGASYSVNDYEAFTESDDYYDNLMNEFE